MMTSKCSKGQIHRMNSISVNNTGCQLLDFNENNNMMNMYSSNVLDKYLLGTEDNNLGGPMPSAIMQPPLEKHYSTPFPFSTLAASNNFQNNPLFGGNPYRNSFDFLEMGSNNLLESTGANY